MGAKKKTYLIAVYPDENGCCMAKFPDFPELAPDFGKNFEDCVLESSRFLDAVIADKVERNKPIPDPTSATEFRAKLDPADGEPLCVVPVTVFLPAKTERINITGKSDVFARIDAYAKRHHLTRSDLMIRSTLEYIQANS